MDGSMSQAGGAAPATGTELAHQGVRSLDFLGDVVLDVTVELGRTRMSIGRIVSLRPGAVLELDKGAAELLDIRVADRFVARGEALVVNDRFAVRITEINEAERARQASREVTNA